MDRIQLKNQAKKRMGTALGFFLIMAFLGYLVSLSFLQYSVDLESWQVTILLAQIPVKVLTSAEAQWALQKIGLFVIVYTILIGYPFEYGFKNCFLAACRGEFHLNRLLDGFKEGYSRVMTVFVFRDLSIFLWSCLFLLPGLMKAYSYRFVPYLAKEHPELSPMAILRLSSSMTAGLRWQIFVLDLSFLGWKILENLTYGMSRLYSGPYYQLTDAGLYQQIHQQWILENGEMD